MSFLLLYKNSATFYCITAYKQQHPYQKDIFMIPFVTGTSGKLGSICREYGLQPVFQQSNNIRLLLMRVKEPHKHVNKGIIYRILPSSVRRCAQGETGRPLKVRITVQKRAVKTGDVKNANAVHWMQNEHDMDRSSGWKDRKIKESVHIKRNRTTNNMDSGYSLPCMGLTY